MPSDIRNWFRQAVIYQVLIDRFAGCRPGPPDRRGFQGGHLRALTARLDYLQDLGVDVVWLSPFTAASTYHGYHVTDFTRVEPRFGTRKDLADLIAAAHGRGMRVIADWVPNHCSREHPAFRAARRTRGSPWGAWFRFDRWPAPYACFLEVRELPKLDLERPAVRAHVTGAALQWLALGLDGFRLDHVIGPSHAFWRHFAQAVRSRFPSAMLIGEAWGAGIQSRHLSTLGLPSKAQLAREGFPQETLQRAYVGLLDGVLDVRFRELLEGWLARGATAAGLERLERRMRRRYTDYPAGFLLPAFLDNHDMSRFLFLCRGDTAKLRAAAGLQLRLPQPAVIYYGTETGLSHRAAVDVARPGSDLQARLPMNWEQPDRGLRAFYRTAIRRRRAAALGRIPQPKGR